MSGTDDADGRWMTYAELAAARGIDHQSARRMAARLKLQRRKDNVDQTVRVFVPSGRATIRRHGGGQSAPFEAALGLLREQIQAERDRADRAEQGRDEARQQIGRLEAEAEQARQQAQNALQAADDLRAGISAARARGRWARLRAAWRG